MAANTTLTLSGEMMTYLERVFLERSQAQTIHGEGAYEKKHPRNSGKTVTWNRYTPLTVAITGTGGATLTEATNPSEVNITGATVSATVKEYGRFDKVSSLLYATSIDRAAKEKTEVISQNAGEQIDTLIRDELAAGATTQFANGKAALTAVGASDILTVDEVRKAVRTLKKNNALTYSDGYFLGKIGPDTAFDLMDDSVWINAHTYKDGKELYKGEIGKLHKVRFLEASSNQFNETSTATVYSNFFHGREAFGTVSLDESNYGLKIKQPGKSDTSNPLDMFLTIGWKADGFAAKTLNSNWIVNVKSGATA